MVMPKSWKPPIAVIALLHHVLEALACDWVPKAFEVVAGPASSLNSPVMRNMWESVSTGICCCTGVCMTTLFGLAPLGTGIVPCAMLQVPVAA